MTPARQPPRLWKCLILQGDRIVSNYDKSLWTIGEWRTVCEPTEECKGLNACENIIDAMRYVIPDVIAEVEMFGKCIKSSNKYTCERMRILRVWRWEKEDSVALAIFAAKLCLANFEKVYPDDNRPRKAIETAEVCLENPTEKTRSAARSAAWSAAESAAWSAAASAAWSAESAAWSAESAARSTARSAAWSAEFAAESAAWSAESAARSAARKEMHDFLVQRLFGKPAIVP